MKRQKNMVTNIDSRPEWKKLLEQAAQLQQQNGEAVYDRIRILNTVFEDEEFRADSGVVDDFAAASILDRYVEDLCRSFLEFRSMLAFYPKKSDWETGRLQTMYNEMVLAKGKPVEQKEVRRRRSVTLAEYEALLDQNKRLEKKVKDQARTIKMLRERLEELESEKSLACA